MNTTEVLRSLYEALSKGDVAGVLARLDPDVVVDEPAELPYGGVNRGRDVFLQSVLGVMMSHAAVALAGFTVYDGGDGKAIGVLEGTLTAHATGEQFPLTMVEVHEIAGEVSRRIDVYLKNPADLAAFYARSAPAS
ncbi:nuclear transport factor 2 family protein [Actinoplanes sp. LDG1-06]|uniref:Nuclear transport factor 2 family protein n=1 Tax=Paractinoplanes ovalisporus TaxID=2810368 RepID=A0ABS2AM48_9ACTN|nr:nuclear transport factor 2 family protein [Actinoplanes ovalisporus]MBM2620923.1 nuclear transport factor 2 family protein [Actinoplanes ovalisporus]